MARFAAAQPDLFAPEAKARGAPAGDPLVELRALLERLRAAERPPWPEASAAMAEELHALGLARGAGAEGKLLAAAILEETERLLAQTD